MVATARSEEEERTGPWAGKSSPVSDSGTGEKPNGRANHEKLGVGDYGAGRRRNRRHGLQEKVTAARKRANRMERASRWAKKGKRRAGKKGAGCTSRRRERRLMAREGVVGQMREQRNKEFREKWSTMMYAMRVWMARTRMRGMVREMKIGRVVKQMMAAGNGYGQENVTAEGRPRVEDVGALGALQQCLQQVEQIEVAQRARMVSKKHSFSTPPRLAEQGATHAHAAVSHLATPPLRFLYLEHLVLLTVNFPVRPGNYQK